MIKSISLGLHIQIIQKNEYLDKILIKNISENEAKDLLKLHILVHIRQYMGLEVIRSLVQKKKSIVLNIIDEILRLWETLVQQLCIKVYHHINIKKLYFLLTFFHFSFEN